MKLLFTILTAFICVVCFGQTPYPLPYQNLGGLNIAVRDTGGLFVRQTLVAPQYADTTAANLSPTKFYSGSVIKTVSPDAFWFRNAAASQWVQFASSGGSSVNIYNSDGELTGNRTLKGDNLNLLFDSLAIGTLMSRGNSSTDSSFLTVDNTNNLATQVGYNSGGATSLVSVEPTLATLEHTNNGLISSFQANQSGQAAIRADDKLSLITNGSGGFKIQSTNAQPIVFQREGGGSVYLFTNTNVNSLFRVNSSTARFIDTLNNKYIDIVPNSAGVAINLTGSAPLFINNQSVGANTINTNAQTINGNNVAQNSTRNAVVLSEWRSTTMGLLFPRMTGAQMNAIISPPTGMIVQCTDSSNSPICYWTGSSWRKLLSQTGGNATLTGVINVTVDTVTNSICTQFADSSVSCYPLSGDSVRVVGDTSICVYTDGSSDCFVSSGDTFVVAGGIDSITIIGDVFCIWSVGSSECVNINNSNGFVTTASLSADSTQYDFYSGSTYLFSLQTLLRSLYAGSGILINDTIIDGRATTVIYNIGGSGSGTLQDAFDAAPTADPQINAHGNTFNVDSVGDASFFKYYGGVQNSLYGFESDGVFTVFQSTIDGVKNVNMSFDAGAPNVSFLTSDSFSRGSQITLSDKNLQISSNSTSINNFQNLLEIDSLKTIIVNNVSSPTPGFIKMGVNTISPSAPLHVVGDGSITAAFMNGNVGIGTTTPDASAILDLTSDSKGLLTPRMTEAERDAIGSPETGLLIYQTNNNPGFYEYNGSAWVSVGASASFAVTDKFYFRSAAGQPQDGNIFDSSSVAVTNLTNDKIYVPHDAKFGDDATGTFLFGQDVNSECDNVYLFGRNHYAPGSTSSNEASGVFGWSGYLDTSPSSVLFALKGGVVVNLVSSPNTFKVAADSLILNGYTKIEGNVVPSANNTYDLGDGTNKWNNLYVGFSSSLAAATATSLALGSTLGSSAIADFTSTTKAFYKPRMTTSQMNAVSSPAAGAEIYNTDEGSTFTYSTDWGWESDNLRWRTKFGTEYFNELLGIYSTATGSIGDGNITTFASGGIVSTLVTPPTNRQGIVELSTSTSSTGRALIGTSTGAAAQSMILGGGRLLYETNIQVPTLSTSGERYQLLSGMASTNNSVNVSNGVMFLYDEGGVSTGSAASANWQVYTAALSSRTFTTTSVAVTAGQWYRLTAIVNAAGTSVGFYIDGALVRTETATIPTAALGITNQIFKSVGTTARTAQVDYIYFKQKYTTAK